MSVKKIIVLASFAFFVIVGQIFAEDILDPITYRYKLTVEFDTPDGMKSGSSVIEVKRIFDKWGGEESTAKGDAVFVDLGRGQNAVALLAHGKRAGTELATTIAPRVFFYNVIGKPTTKSAQKLTKMVGKSKKLEGNLIPTIVTFDDINVPKSMKLLYATHYHPKVKEPSEDNVKIILGKGYKFRSATVTIVDDPVVRNVESHLPWVTNEYKSADAYGRVAKGHHGGISSYKVFLAEGPDEYLKTLKGNK